MSSLLHKLGSNEAILLMYLADELPREDRAEVEELLSADAGMRAELDRLRGVDEMLAGATSADGGMSRAGDEMAVRRVLREMKRHQAELVLRPKPAPADTGRAWPLWTVPIAAAAAALFLFVGLWGFGFIDFAPVPGGLSEQFVDGRLDSDEIDDGFIDEDPVPYSSEQFVLLDDVGYFLEEAAIHVEQLELLDSDGNDPLLLMKDPV